MEKMFRMTDGTILTTSNEVVIEQFESRPEIYEPITEADLKAEVKPKKAKKEAEVKPEAEASAEEVAEVETEAKPETQGK
ncbi:MAG: hypothetical protein NNC33_02745 [Candidatus Nanosyncoccus sp. P13S_S20_bin.18.1]|nr:hypothetical protein [Candidatus Nanosyncoccus sp. P13S_S20_bin.18.1]